MKSTLKRLNSMKRKALFDCEADDDTTEKSYSTIVMELEEHLVIEKDMHSKRVKECTKQI